MGNVMFINNRINNSRFTGIVVKDPLRTNIYTFIGVTQNILGKSLHNVGTSVNTSLCTPLNITLIDFVDLLKHYKIYYNWINHILLKYEEWN